MNINLDDWDKITRTLTTAIFAFGIKHLVDKTSISETELRKICEEVKVFRSNELNNLPNTLSKEKLIILQKVFISSYEIVDEKDEISANTGFSDEEILETNTKLKELIEQVTK